MLLFLQEKKARFHTPYNSLVNAKYTSDFLSFAPEYHQDVNPPVYKASPYQVMAAKKFLKNNQVDVRPSLWPEEIRTAYEQELLGKDTKPIQKLVGTDTKEAERITKYIEKEVQNMQV